jgi:hypothetical protein
MKIVADENIPCVEQAFASLGEVTLLPGRGMQAADVHESAGSGASSVWCRSGFQPRSRLEGAPATVKTIVPTLATQ